MFKDAGSQAERVAAAPNADNFSLADMFAAEGASLLDRVAPFSRYFRSESASGRALYGRELLGPAARRVTVRDHAGTVREMVMLGSNNYLGLTTDPHVIWRVRKALDEYGCGVAGPPLLNGMSRLHRELEEKLAGVKGHADAMLFGSGFQANQGWLCGLARKGDVLIYDELHHASMFDAVAMAGERIHPMRFRHNDMTHLEALLKRYTAQRKPGNQIFIAVEGVYSMDGDLAPLPHIVSLCRKYDAICSLDDAHGTGVLGPRGHGTAEHFGLDSGIDLAMGTFSKTFGVTGGFLAAGREIIDYLRFFARPYMFSAHLPCTVVAAVLGGLEVMEREPERIRQLQDNARYLRQGLAALGIDVPGVSAILAVRIPASVDIRAMNLLFHEQGLFLNSIEYPAVPRDTQRLRLSPMATHTREDLDFAIDTFRLVMRRFGL